MVRDSYSPLPRTKYRTLSGCRESNPVHAHPMGAYYHCTTSRYFSTEPCLALYRALLWYGAYILPLYYIIPRQKVGSCKQFFTTASRILPLYTKLSTLYSELITHYSFNYALEHLRVVQLQQYHLQ